MLAVTLYLITAYLGITLICLPVAFKKSIKDQIIDERSKGFALGLLLTSVFFMIPIFIIVLISL